VGPRDGLDAVEKRARSIVTILTELHRLNKVFRHGGNNLICRLFLALYHVRPVLGKPVTVLPIQEAETCEL
jgi:hypothetical protein